MAIKTKTILKTFFETGDRPTQENYEDLIDSLAHVDDSSGGSSGNSLTIVGGNFNSYETIKDANGNSSGLQIKSDGVRIGNGVTGHENANAILLVQTDSADSVIDVSTAGDFTPRINIGRRNGSSKPNHEWELSMDDSGEGLTINNNGTALGGTSTPVFGFDADGNAHIGSDTAPSARLEIVKDTSKTNVLHISSSASNPGNLMAVKSSGKNGFGTSSPDATLHIHQDNADGSIPILKVSDGSSINSEFTIGDENNNSNEFATKIFSKSEGNNRQGLLIEGEGSNDNSGTASVIIRGTFQNGPAGSSPILVCESDTTEVFRVTPTGSIGINEQNPTSIIHVQGMPMFMNNNDALMNGLTMGAFYATPGGELRIVI